MGIFAIEGFETREPIPQSSFITSRFGAGTALQMSVVAPNSFKVFEAPGLDRYTFGAAYRSSSYTSHTLASFTGSTNLHTRLSITAGGEVLIEAQNLGGGNSYTEVGRSGPLGVTNNAWMYLEFSILLHRTDGSVRVKVNGEVVLDLPVVATLMNAVQVPTMNSVTIYRGAVTMSWDDLYLSDELNHFQGECNIVGLLPNGNGDSSQFVGSDGNSTDNYLLVDEVPANTTDYVGAEPVGSKDLYQMSNLPANTTAVAAVKVTTYDTKTDSGEKTARTVFKGGGVEGYGPTRPVSTSYSYTKEVFDSSPITGNEWTPSEVDGMQVGVQVVT